MAVSTIVSCLRVEACRKGGTQGNKLRTYHHSVMSFKTLPITAHWASSRE
jgi:hypothetical protein